MKNTIAILVLAALCAALNANESAGASVTAPFNIYTPVNMVFEEKAMLKFRSCFVAQVGGDYVKRVVQTMIRQYIARYNSDEILSEETLKRN